MDKNVIKTVKQYARTISKHIPVRAVILYGSYARGTQRKDSDIDVAVVVDRIERNYLKTWEQLFHFVWAIDPRIEPVLVSKHNDESGFLESIAKYGKIVYTA